MKRKSILKALLLTVLMCCLTFALVACGGKHTVTFNYGVDGNGDGEVDVVTVEVGDGSLLEEPTDVPTRDGYTFVGWGTDNGMWNFEEDTVTADITLNARWSAGDPIDPGTPGTTVYVNYELGDGAAKSASAPPRWSGAPGTTIKLPAAPAAGAGWEFTGWLVTGETELRAAGSDYTVTGTVTITAQWKSFTKISPEWDTDGLIDDRGEVLKDLVGTYTPAGGGDITVTIAKDVLSAAMQTFLENAEEEGSMATTPETGAFHAEEKAPSCLTDGTGTLYYTVYYQVPETSLYVEESVAVYTFPISAQGHFCTNWNVTVAPTEGSTGTAQSVCTTCGNTISVTLPKFTESNVVTEETELAEGYYFKETKQELTCEQDGIVDYQYMFTSSDLTNAKVSTSDSTVKTVSFTVTTPATGHNYPDSVSYENEKFTAVCSNDECSSSYSVTVKFEAGEGTGTATGLTATFNADEHSFTFNLPSSGYTATSGGTFIGFIVKDGDGTNLNPGQSITLNADDSVTYVAQYGAHEHSYGTWEITNPSANAAGTAKRTCPICGEGTEGKTQTVTLPMLTEENISSAEGGEAGKYIKTVKSAGSCTEDREVEYSYKTASTDSCGEGLQITFTITTQASGHIWSNISWSENTASATCQNSGCEEQLSATVTFTALEDELTGTPSLSADNFSILNNALVLTLPENPYTLTIAQYFDGWKIGDETYQPKAQVTVSGTVEITPLAGNYSESRPLEIGEPGNTTGYTAMNPLWSAQINQGEKIVLSGSATSTGANSWNATVLYLWSGSAPVGNFRADNYLNGGDTMQSTEGWTIVSGATPVDDWDSFKASIANCTITITFDWRNPDMIIITTKMVGNSNNATETMVYTVFPSSGTFTKTSYNIGLGCDMSYTKITSIAVSSSCSENHTWNNGVCTDCGVVCMHDYITAGTCSTCGMTATSGEAQTYAVTDWNNAFASDTTNPKVVIDVAKNTAVSITTQIATETSNAAWGGLVTQVWAKANALTDYTRTNELAFQQGNNNSLTGAWMYSSAVCSGNQYSPMQGDPLETLTNKSGYTFKVTVAFVGTTVTIVYEGWQTESGSAENPAYSGVAIYQNVTQEALVVSVAPDAATLTGNVSVVTTTYSSAT